MRLFAAAFIPERISENIYKYSSRAAADFGVKAVAAKNMHITLKFFGDKRPENCLKILENSVRNINKFAVDVKETGFFSYGRFAGVLWAGIGDENGYLNKIALNIDDSQKKFIPHVTLARFKDDTVENDVLEKYLFENKLKENVFGSFKIERVSLAESLTGAGGARYNILKDFYLGE